MTKKKISKVILICIALAAVVLSVFIVSVMNSDTSAIPVEQNAKPWSFSQTAVSDDKEGTKIPGYSNILFPSGEKNVPITLYNPKENDSIFVYTIFLDGEDEPIYTSKGIEPGKAIENITLSKPLESGNYTLKIHIAPYDIKSNTMLNNAVVTANLTVI